MGSDSLISYHVRRQIWFHVGGKKGTEWAPRESVCTGDGAERCCRIRPLLQIYPCEVWFPLNKRENFPSLNQWLERKPESTIRTRQALLCLLLYLAYRWYTQEILICIAYGGDLQVATHTLQNRRNGWTKLLKVETIPICILGVWSVSTGYGQQRLWGCFLSLPHYGSVWFRS